MEKHSMLFFTTSCRKAVNTNPKKDAEVSVGVDENHVDSGLLLFALSCATHRTSLDGCSF